VPFVFGFYFISVEQSVRGPISIYLLLY